MQEKVYISIIDDDDKRQLTIDGDLSLFDRLLATLRGNQPKCLPTAIPADCCGGTDCLDCHCSNGGALPFDCEPRRE